MLGGGQYIIVTEVKRANRGLFGACALFSLVRLSACKRTANDVAFHWAVTPALKAYSASAFP